MKYKSPSKVSTALFTLISDTLQYPPPKITIYSTQNLQKKQV